MNSELEGRQLRVQWAKAVRSASAVTSKGTALALPSKPLVPVSSAPSSRSGGGGGWGGGDGDRGAGRNSDRHTHSRPRDAAASAPGSKQLPRAGAAAAAAPLQPVPPGAKIIKVVIPADPLQKARIDLLARYVATDKQGIESRVMERERGNLDTKFGFLFDLESPDGLYYRWRVAACVMGDDSDTYRTHPFQMTPNGPYWQPPEPLRQRRWVQRCPFVL